MKTKPIAKRWGTNSIGLVAVCLAFYAVADSLLIARAWFLDNDRLLVAMGLLLSQCSLAAAWASSSHANPFLRFALPGVASVACWYVLTRILPWGIGEPAAAAWAIAIGVQTLAVVMAINLYKRVRDLAAQRRAHANRRYPSPFTFDVRTLMLWTTVIALGFGFIEFGRAQWRWTANVANWDFFEAMPIVGMFNALLALLWLWALTDSNRWWRCAKIAIALLLIGVLVYLLSHLLGWTIGSTAIGLRSTFVLAAAQSLFLAGSIAIVRVGLSNRTPSVAS